MSVAKGLIAGHILEDQVFPYPQATGVGRDKLLSSMPQLLREPAGICERYTVELARTCDFLLRKRGKSIADRQHALRRAADIAIYGARRATRTKR
jgi:hypothetical protein